jgi:outer membrane lipoprotein-sorting protein
MKLFLILFSLLSTTTLWALDPAELLAQSAKNFTQHSDWSLNYQLRMQHQSTGEVTQQQGALALSSKDRFYLQTQDLEVMSNGVDLWEYHVPARQVVVKSLLDLDHSMHPSRILTSYLRCKPIGVEMQELLGNQVPVVQLDPTGQINTLQAMSVWLDPKEFTPLRIHTLDLAGNQTWYDLSRLERKKFVADFFDFKIPAGVEELDMR